MLSAIEKGGIDQVMAYAAALDRWDGRDPELSAPDIARLIDRLPAELRQALDVGQERTEHFAVLFRDKLADYEAEIAPGLVTGVRYIPVERVGAYLPAGRFPLTASAFMTVNVAKVAGVPTVLACTPPQPDGGPNPAVLYAAHVSGVDRVFVLGGVQALAAMAFGLLGEPPVDMLVGAGNAYVAEAKRQLFGPRRSTCWPGPPRWPSSPTTPRTRDSSRPTCSGRPSTDPSPQPLWSRRRALGREVVDRGRTPAGRRCRPGHLRSGLGELRLGHGRDAREAAV